MSTQSVDNPVDGVRCVRRPGSVWTSCTCTPCRALMVRRQKDRDAGILVTAYPPPRLQAEAWDVLETLRGRGWSKTAVASATGLPAGTVGNLLRDVERGNRHALFAPTVHAVLSHGVPTAGRVGIVGSMRRARGMARLGWSTVEVTARWPVGPSAWVAVLQGCAGGRVTAGTAAVVARAAAEVGDRTGGSWQTVRAARLRGWAPLYAWEGLDVDDPGVVLPGFPSADVQVLARVDRERRDRRRAVGRAGWRERRAIDGSAGGLNG